MAAEHARQRQDADRERRLRSAGWFWLRAAACLASVWLGYQILLIVRAWLVDILDVVLFVAFGAVLALIAEPAVRVLGSRGVPRWMAIAVVMLGGLVAFGAIVLWVGLDLAQEITLIGRSAPAWIARLQQYYHHSIQPVLSAHGMNLRPSSISPRALGPELPSLVLTGIAGAIRLLVGLVVTVVSCAWLLGSARELRDGLLRSVPSSLRNPLAFATEAVIAVIGGYVRAQLLMAILIGSLAGLGCAFLGVPFPVVVGTTAALFEFVPIVGPFAGALVAALLALTVGWGLLLWTLLLFLGIHVLEGYVLAPRVQGRFVRIHPYLAFLALFAGADVGGLLGALFAVPVASMLSVFIRAALAERRARHPDEFAPDGGDPLLERRRRLLQDFTIVDRGRSRQLIATASRRIRRVFERR